MLQTYCVFFSSLHQSVDSFADIGNGLLLTENSRHRWISHQIRSLSSLIVVYQHGGCYSIHNQDIILKPGCGLSCYQCRSDEIAECGDPFISSRFDHHGRHNRSHQNCHICNDAVMTIECVGSQGRSAMCSTPSQAASATKPPSLVGLNLHTV